MAMQMKVKRFNVLVFKVLTDHIPHLPQQCHNYKCEIFSGEPFKGFEVL
jgi:hypothetical protein